MRREAHAGLEERLEGRAEEDKPAYRERLDFEIDVITRMGFAGYFLIVADFIQWAKANDIPVGPGPRLGRGLGRRLGADHHRSRPDRARTCCSSASSTPSACRCPTSTSISAKPTATRSSPTSSSKYGRDQVAQIITFGRLKARAVLKDTGRVLQMSYGQVDRLAKLIPNHPTDPWTLRARAQRRRRARHANISATPTSSGCSTWR